MIETGPRKKDFVLWGHCQNLLDDPRNSFDFFLLLLSFDFFASMVVLIGYFFCFVILCLYCVHVLHQRTTLKVDIYAYICNPDVTLVLP